MTQGQCHRKCIEKEGGMRFSSSICQTKWSACPYSKFFPKIWSEPKHRPGISIVFRRLFRCWDWAAVVDACYEALFRNTLISSFGLHRALQKTIPLSVFMKEKIEALRTWAAVRTRPANKKSLGLIPAEKWRPSSRDRAEPHESPRNHSIHSSKNSDFWGTKNILNGTCYISIPITSILYADW